MLGKILSVGVFGIDGYRVEVEFDVRSGLPAVVVVGLPDAAVKESKDRVATALKPPWSSKRPMSTASIPPPPIVRIFVKSPVPMTI